MMGITIGFAWKPEAEVDTKNVELLISKAEDIYKDGFDQCFDNPDLAVEAVRYSTYNLEQWNADGGSFCACPSLEPGVYQFVFRVDNGKEKELKISDYYETTFLGSGRAVNYIELPGNSKVDNRSNTKNKRKTQGELPVVNPTSNKKSQGATDSNSYSQHGSKSTRCTLL